METGRQARIALVLTLSASLVLADCATKEQTGTLAGAAAGAAVGAAAAGHSKYAGVAILIGALAGAIAGSIVGKQLDDADRRAAAEAAQQAATAEDGQRVAWTSQRDPSIHGYAEPLGPTFESSSRTFYCLDPANRIAYTFVDRPCLGNDRQLTEADYRAWERDHPLPAPSASPTTATTTVTCRNVREVVFIDGNEKKEEARYCRHGGTWSRA